MVEARKENHSLPRRVVNPPNPYHKYSVEWLDTPPVPKLEIYQERAHSILSENKSPDIGFRYSINPYRGCFHGCAYCYARPTHQYLDFGAGTDFERKIVVKLNAPELLYDAFMKPSWAGERIIFSGNTDCYQPLESHYELTRRLLEKCVEFRNPIAVITKGVLIRRDIDVLQELSRHTSVHITMSIAFADDDICRAIEPYTPRPSTRFRAMKELTDAGLSVGIGIAPVISGLTDKDIPTLLSKAVDNGAKTAFMTLLRLPGPVKDIFLKHIQEVMPDRAAKIENGVREMKGGVLNRNEFGQRMHGVGNRWDAVQWLFDSTCDKLGLNQLNDASPSDTMSPGLGERGTNTFRRPSLQLSLFS